MSNSDSRGWIAIMVLIVLGLLSGAVGRDLAHDFFTVEPTYKVGDDIEVVRGIYRGNTAEIVDGMYRHGFDRGWEYLIEVNYRKAWVKESEIVYLRR